MILQENQRVNVVVRGLIFQDDHLLAAQRRTDGITFPIGGRVEFGEPLIEALHREVREETGAEITAYRLVYFAEIIFIGDNGLHYHEYGWYFWVEADRPACRLDEIIPNPDHPDGLVIRYLPLSQEGLSSFWPRFLRQYLPTDWAQRFAAAPRYLYCREDRGDEIEVQELTGLFDGLHVA